MTVQPLVVGVCVCTSIICTAPNFSRTERGVNRVQTPNLPVAPSASSNHQVIEEVPQLFDALITPLGLARRDTTTLQRSKQLHRFIKRMRRKKQKNQLHTREGAGIHCSGKIYIAWETLQATKRAWNSLERPGKSNGHPVTKIIRTPSLLRVLPILMVSIGLALVCNLYFITPNGTRRDSTLRERISPPPHPGLPRPPGSEAYGPVYPHFGEAVRRALAYVLIRVLGLPGLDEFGDRPVP